MLRFKLWTVGRQAGKALLLRENLIYKWLQSPCSSTPCPRKNYLKCHLTHQKEQEDTGKSREERALRGEITL